MAYIIRSEESAGFIACSFAGGNFPERNGLLVRHVLPVCRLFFACSPSAVIRFVAARVVDSVNRLSCRAFAHVVKKCLEGLKPTVANSNASPAVSGVTRVALVRASAFHANPRLIRRGHAKRIAGVTVLCPSFATAGYNAPTDKIVAQDFVLVSAIALANPVNTNASCLSRLACSTYNRKSPKSLAYEIGCFSHDVHPVT